jgi:hypothetical protein
LKACLDPPPVDAWRGAKLVGVPLSGGGVHGGDGPFRCSSRRFRASARRRRPHECKRLRTSQIVLGLLCLMYFITYLDRVNVSTAAAGFAKDFNLNKTEIGLVFSAFAYPYLVFQIIGGWISDRFGARRTLIACGLVWASATVLTGLAGGLASAAALPSAARLGRRRHFSCRHHRHVSLGPDGTTRLRARSHACGRAHRQRRGPRR